MTDSKPIKATTGASFRLSRVTKQKLTQQSSGMSLPKFQPMQPKCPPNPLHIAALGGVPPQMFKTVMKGVYGPKPNLDAYLDEPLTEFPNDYYHAHILANFPEIKSIREIRLIAMGKKPLEILQALSEYSGRPYLIDNEYFDWMNLSSSPLLKRTLKL